mmetsp:Transcript_1591/g.1845  ORF Transcript_1591/g.1845 Transcript_1591/m.1845 type:complete len:114 (+) Transcript_1591:187-528(+)
MTKLTRDRGDCGEGKFDFDDDDSNEAAELLLLWQITTSNPLDFSSVVSTVLILNKQSWSTIGEDDSTGVTRAGRSDTAGAPVVSHDNNCVVTTSQESVDTATTAATTIKIRYV